MVTRLLASLDEEEAMIRSSSHPLLIDLQTNLERGRLVKHRQAHLKHEALKTYFARQHHEQEQRIWSNWAVGVYFAPLQLGWPFRWD